MHVPEFDRIINPMIQLGGRGLVAAVPGGKLFNLFDRNPKSGLLLAALTGINVSFFLLLRLWLCSAERCMIVTGNLAHRDRIFR